MSENNFEKTVEQAAAFQKIWTESFSKMFQTAFASGPASPPPDLLRQIRSGIFQALAQSWDEFMRSPQFIEGMKQWMDNAVNFRKMSNDWMARVRNEVQAPSRDDIDTVMLSVRHMEKRLLDRLETLAAQVNQLNGGHAKSQIRKPSANAAPKKTPQPGSMKSRSAKVKAGKP